MPRSLTLLLGGARSGKSARALDLARATTGRVLFVATAEALDDEMATRIATHRQERPVSWDTLEEPRALAEALEPRRDAYDVVVVDCLTLWVSNLMTSAAPAPNPLAELRRALDVYHAGHASWIIVSNEVGLGLVPDTRLGRDYRDTLGAVNRLVASHADTVTFMVAGLPLVVKS
jgi:adenosylcobinamide kinase / adenosylcobinamide-phosphate guanylyltransferase